MSQDDNADEDWFFERIVLESPGRTLDEVENDWSLFDILRHHRMLDRQAKRELLVEEYQRMKEK